MKKNLLSSYLKNISGIVALAAIPLLCMSLGVSRPSSVSSDIADTVRSGITVESTDTLAESGAGPGVENYMSVKAFMDLDVNVLEILSKDAREYMVLFLQADSLAEVPNEFNGFSRIEEVSEDYLKVKLTEVSSFQIKILKTLKNQDIVMTIYTIGDSTEAPDSQISFFSYPGLTKLEADKYIKLPDLKDFFEIPKGSLTSMKEIRQMVPFPTMVFTTGPSDDILRGSLTVEKYVNMDDYNILKLFLKPELKYYWDGKKFKQQ